MMKIIKIFLILAILFISISAVSADGNFTALQDEIDSSTDFLEITQDYVYDNSTDYELIKGINITKSNFTINGNGYTIDGSNQARIFVINGTNITINNLNFINGNAGNGADLCISPNSSVTTNNVVFKDNNGSAMGGAIVNYGIYTSINDSFINNYANRGGAIFSQNGELNIINGTFSSENIPKWGLVYMMYTSMHIENSTFANTTSNYSTAIYATQSTGKIRKSTFVNLTATMTAGAIGIREHLGDITIDDCDFISTLAGKNGGAIYADVGGEHRIGDGNITILNSRFTSCISEFGGAYLQLCGHLMIDSTNFTSNIASFDGGAIYTSWVDTVNISNSIFTSNQGYYDGFSNGGAAYFDMGEVTLDSCIFKNNTASEGSSLYTYDCNVSLFNNYFNNPTENGTSIYGVYCKYYESGNNFTDDELSLNNTNYDMNVESSQTKFTLLNNTIDVETLPERFDLRDWGWVSSVKNQGNRGACWAFGITGALESVLIRYANVTYDFSENNLQNTMLMYSKYGIKDATEDGSVLYGAYYYSSWLGVSPAQYDTYDELGKISPLIATDDDVHMKDIVFVMPRMNSTDNEALKEALIKYGAISVGYYHAFNPSYYNETTYGYYNYENFGLNHIVCLVGWNDTYPKENFAVAPPGDGAFIIKNSWGTDWGEEGFFYISYYDVSLATVSPSMTFDLKNNKGYDKLYQHEIGYNSTLNYTYAMNKFVAEENLLIAAVGAFTEVDSYDFSILVNGEKAYEQNGTYDYEGYLTVELDEYIPVKKGDEFAVISKSTNQNLGTVRIHAQPHVSFVSHDGVEWEDLTEKEAVVMIKVYTFDDNRPGTAISAKDKSIYVNDAVNGYDYRFELKDENGTALSDMDVQVSFNGKTQTVTTDENGQATATLKANTEGKYTVELTFEGDNDYRETSKNATITLKKQKTTIYAQSKKADSQEMSNGYTYTAILKDNNGKPIANREIIFVFDGKEQTAKTDKNGNAAVTLKTSKTGLQTITIKFKGDNAYQETSTTKTITIKSEDNQHTQTAPKITKASQKLYNAIHKQKVVLKIVTKEIKLSANNKKVIVSLKTITGKPIAGVKITITINGKTYTAITDENGTATFVIDITQPGNYTITAQFNGTAQYAPTNATAKIEIY